MLDSTYFPTSATNICDSINSTDLTECWLCVPYQQNVYYMATTTFWNISHLSYPHNPAIVGPLAIYVSSDWPTNLTYLVYLSHKSSHQMGNLPHCTRNITSSQDKAICSTWGWLIGCQIGAYTCLPSQWAGSCTLILLVPAFTINSQEAIENAFNSQLHDDHFTGRMRAIHAPALVGMGILSLLSVALEGRRMGIAVHLYHQLSSNFHQQIEHITTTIHSIQNQINSLAMVTS